MNGKGREVRGRWLGPVLGALGVMMLVGLAPATGEAAHVQCDQVVSGHVKLDSNVECMVPANCLSCTALTVGSDNTMIDLNGFTIECRDPTGYPALLDLTAIGSCQGGAGFETGIDTKGRSNVLIKGPGTIKGFDIGVLVDGGAEVNVRRITVTGPPKPATGPNPRPPSAGILVQSTQCPTPVNTIINVHGNDVSNHSDGIELFDANCVNLGFNFVHDNNGRPKTTDQSHGILAEDSTNNNFNNNLVTANGENNECVADTGVGCDGGLTVRGAMSTTNTVVHNNVSANFGDGISMRTQAHDNQIVNNQARDNGTSTPGAVYFDLAGRSSGPGNNWNKNNQCNTQNAEVPPGVCAPGE